MRKDEELVRFSVSLPASLLDALDHGVGKGYASRSEYIRDLIREKRVDDKWAEGAEEVAAVLTIGYDHHQRELSQKLTEIQHNQYIHILCSTHVHLDHHYCLETIILKGPPQEIESISAALAGLRGVRFAKLTRAAKV
jgi:CopG family nickel-responsive transcriptional regulator